LSDERKLKGVENRVLRGKFVRKRSEKRGELRKLYTEELLAKY
jgi:hypothetical protein